MQAVTRRISASSLAFHTITVLVSYLQKGVSLLHPASKGKMGQGRTCMLHDREEVGGEGLLIHLLQADQVRVVSQHLLRYQGPPVGSLHVPAQRNTFPTISHTKFMNEEGSVRLCSMHCKGGMCTRHVHYAWTAA